MELQQDIEINGSVSAVWEALNDPEVLKRCLPGCEAFDATAENAYDIRTVSYTNLTLPTICSV